MLEVLNSFRRVVEFIINRENGRDRKFEIICIKVILKDYMSFPYSLSDFQKKNKNALVGPEVFSKLIVRY